MSDTTDAPAATEPPASTAFDPTAFEARITSLMDERVKGFQRAISEKDQTIADLQRQLKTASMSEEEREQLAVQERQEADEALRLENALLKLGQQGYAREVEIVQKMLQGDSVEAYVTALREAFEAVQPSKEPEQEVSDVDRNNPPAMPVAASAGADMITLPDGSVITREQGLALLKGATSLS